MDLHHLLLAGLPAHSGLPRSTDIVRPPRHVGLVPWIGIGGASRLRPSHTNVYGGSKFDSCWLGVGVHAPPRAIRCLPVPPAGLHPSAPMRSPVSTGCSAACRSRG